MASEDHLPALAPGPRGPVNKQPFPLTKPRKNSIACQPCKQAKRKCTGRPAPCKACENTDAECVFDETLDLRRKVAARCTLGELEYYRGVLYSLLEMLRSSHEEKLNHVLETIRGSTLLSNIAAAMDEPIGDLSDTSSENTKSIGNPEDAIAQHERLAADAHSRITLEKLCDMPVLQVSAKPWSTLTDDDHLVSHLVSLYFTWDHPLTQIVDQNLFLEHMRQGRVDSNFCTPLLVNSILAMASTYSDFPEVFATPGEVASKGLQFFNEAEALWKAEEGRSSLANIQALVLMSHVQMAMETQKMANLSPPIFERVKPRSIDDDVRWIPYPRSNYIDYAKRPALLSETMSQMANLTEVIVEIQELLFEKAFDMAIGEICISAGGLYSRLETWFRNLPDYLEIDKDGLQIPQVLSLQYHHAIILLFDFLIRHEDFEPMSRQAHVDQAKFIRLQSAKRIADYLLLYHESYGLEQVPRQLLEPTHVSSLILLTVLKESNDELKEAFAELCRFLVAFGKRFTLAGGMVANVEATARSFELKLPPEAAAVLAHRDMESSQWL
ncbi:hypothetical protein BDV25DRAFT_133262 [Aspergillus avenaceus]|uniref:Zn(2)-C6 fungal-type domain-containing protein n=1 Tax=Aspergillus avenaceus TaxID=36643 RepID=A0A5N6TI38_ASPAV|nr:hypothetical protein BDV25DRAFT_133262 [Aspergillus avenaceus]